MTEETAEQIISAIAERAAMDCETSQQETGEIDQSALRTLSNATRIHNQLNDAQRKVRAIVTTINTLSLTAEYDLGSQKTEEYEISEQLRQR